MARAVFYYRCDQYAFGRAVCCGVHFAPCGNTYAYAGTQHAAFVYKLLRHLQRLVYRQGETKALCTYCVAVIVITCGNGFCGNYAYYLAGHVYQRPAAVAGVNGGISLNVNICNAVYVHAPCRCAHYAECSRAGKFTSGGVAYGYNEFAHTHGLRIAKLQRLKVGFIHLQHGNVKRFIVAHKLSFRFFTVNEHYAEL